MKQISILGCGWLGLPLAVQLMKKGFSINGSTTTKDKIKVLEKEGIQPFFLQLSENKILGEINSFLENTSILIIDIPPKLRGQNKENFVEKINTLIPHIEKSSIEKLIFISATSVYPDNNTIVREDTIPIPDSESGRQLLLSEQLLKDNKKIKTTVIRFGGLIGEDRHPVHFFAGRKDIENPETPINLIHRLDCIGIIQTVIEKDIWNETFNAVAPMHPNRKEYYTQKAKDYNLPKPEFNERGVSLGKKILSEKLERLLNYQFRVLDF
jgi:nucleoside-diphosphate-sugar epimerase